ncbi:hypothetical protein D3C73_811000 [compost metagenome]
MNRSLEVEKHFLTKRGKGLQISTTDFGEVKKMMASGIPIYIVKDAIDKSFAEYNPKHGRDEIHSMNYCIPRCFSEWERVKVDESITGTVPSVPVALGSPPKRSKQQQELDDLRRRAEEERQREQIRSI